MNNRIELQWKSTTADFLNTANCTLVDGKLEEKEEEGRTLTEVTCRLQKWNLNLDLYMQNNIAV
jgi:hypothetical protein